MFPSKISVDLILLLKLKQIFHALYLGGVGADDIGAVTSEVAGKIGVVDDQHVGYLEHHQ